MPYKNKNVANASERARWARKPLITKTCTECHKEKSAKRWYSNDRCSACHGRTCRKKNPEPYREVDRKRYSPARSAEWRKKNPQRHKELQKKSYEKNKHKFFARNQKRRAVNKQATPKWLTPEHKQQLADIYYFRPEGYHVDHIVPLNGKDVCGLTVPWNLRYITAEENLKKGNR